VPATGLSGFQAALLLSGDSQTQALTNIASIGGVSVDKNHIVQWIRTRIIFFSWLNFG
jgi:hypothetical protein